MNGRGGTMQVAIEQDQSLLQYVARAQAGEEVELTQSGRVVARIWPVLRGKGNTEELTTPLVGTARSDALARFMHLLDVGLPLGGGMAPSKDEMHER